PKRVAFLRNAVADKRRTRRAKCDQLVRIHGDVSGVFGAEGGFGRGVFEEVARHPVIRTGAREVLHGFTEVATVRFGAAFAGGADEHKSEAWLKRHGNKGGFAVAGDALDADLL